MTAPFAADPLVIVSTIRRRSFHQNKTSPPSVRPSHVATMLALAHHLQRALDQGEVDKRAAIARALGLDRVRVTQILNLLQLAPDIQEIVLALQTVGAREPMAERELRSVVGAADWTIQRQRFATLRALRELRSCA